MAEYDEVLFSERSGIGFIHLNRPKALNALTAAMAAAIRDKLYSWNNLKDIKAIVVTGEGTRAFCAGGDVVKVVKSHDEGSDEWRAFFHDEYQMNVAIAECKKPYISFVDGIAMGGGVGVSIPGDFWVATENTLFAMPETGLGLFPDVGGSWFLPRLGGELGMYLALTGARLKAPDLYTIGLATHNIPSSATEQVIADLMDAKIKNNRHVRKILDRHHVEPEGATLPQIMDKIDDHFDYPSVELIMESLSRDPDEWAQKQLKIMQRMSPTSMRVTFEQIRRGLGHNRFRDALRMEYRIVNHMMAGNDFKEGVRAILVDKDNAPQWQPARLEEVRDEDVTEYFVARPENELDLPKWEKKRWFL